MIEKYKDAFGWHVRQTDPRYPDRWLYVYKIHRDGSVDWTTDYSLALRMSEHRATWGTKVFKNEIGGKNHD